MIIRVFVTAVLGFASLNAQSDRKIVISNDIQLYELQDSIFVHVTWHESARFGRFSSNGMIVIRSGKALMIDTPMDNDQTERLTRYLRDSLSVDVERLIIGHFHDDCLGGLGYLQNIGVESVAHAMTVDQCKKNGLPIPSTGFTDSLAFDFGGEQIECRYFGAGHTVDNITVWISGRKILFGGCLIKSVGSKGLGNVADAIVSEWDVTLTSVRNAYPDMKIVIPGHGERGGSDLIDHTIALVQKRKTDGTGE